ESPGEPVRWAPGGRPGAGRPCRRPCGTTRGRRVRPGGPGRRYRRPESRPASGSPRPKRGRSWRDLRGDGRDCVGILPAPKCPKQGPKKSKGAARRFRMEKAKGQATPTKPQNTRRRMAMNRFVKTLLNGIGGGSRPARDTARQATPGVESLEARNMPSAVTFSTLTIALALKTRADALKLANDAISAESSHPTLLKAQLVK